MKTPAGRFTAGALRATRLASALGTLVLVLACEDSPTGPTPTTPIPTPTPANRAPTVTIAGADSCHPTNGSGGVIPCAIALRADAEDPDDDALSYEWSGCGQGTARTVRCSIDRLAELTATVTVSDGHGHEVVASKAIRGVNAVPTNQLPFTCVYLNYRPPSTGTCLPVNQPDCPPVLTGAQVFCGSEPFLYLYDQEGDRVTCAEVTVTGDGCYGTSYEDCGGRGANATFELVTPSFPTVCTYEAYMQDAWGARFKVATFRLPVVR